MAYEWIADQARFNALVAELAGAEAVALDTEFHRERSYFPHLALLQVAWDGGLAVVDPLAVDLRPLGAVLTGPALAVLHAADQDLEVLERACGVVPARLFDTQLAAGFLGLSTPSLQVLAERLLDVRLPKGDRLTDWARRPLSAQQLDYAASDVEHLLALRAALCARLDARGRLAWAEQECEELRLVPRAAREPETAWWRLKEARSLRGPARGVAQEVAAWRERRAAALDLPPRFVLPDLALVAIAQRPPRGRGELGGVRGLDGRHVKGEVGEELLAAVRRGRELDPRGVRQPPSNDMDRGLRPAVALVAAWVAQLASDLEIDTTLLATRADIQSFLAGEPGARLRHGWRHELVGEPVRRLVEGDAALAFEGERLVLEERPRVGPGGAGAPGEG